MGSQNPAEYVVNLKAAFVGIVTFGGVFLPMVFLHVVFDRAKEVCRLA